MIVSGRLISESPHLRRRESCRTRKLTPVRYLSRRAIPARACSVPPRRSTTLGSPRTRSTSPSSAACSADRHRSDTCAQSLRVRTSAARGLQDQSNVNIKYCMSSVRLEPEGGVEVVGAAVLVIPRIEPESRTQVNWRRTSDLLNLRAETALQQRTSGVGAATGKRVFVDCGCVWRTGFLAHVGHASRAIGVHEAATRSGDVHAFRVQTLVARVTCSHSHSHSHTCTLTHHNTGATRNVQQDEAFGIGSGAANRKESRVVYNCT